MGINKRNLFFCLRAREMFSFTHLLSVCLFVEIGGIIRLVFRVFYRSILHVVGRRCFHVAVAGAGPRCFCRTGFFRSRRRIGAAVFRSRGTTATAGGGAFLWGGWSGPG